MKLLIKYIKPLIFIVVLVLFDQRTKILAIKHLMNKEAIVLWDKVFELRYLENRGAAFGIFQNQKIFFIIITIVIAGLLIWFYSQIPDTKRYNPIKIVIATCLAGAIGNFIDRTLNGYVVDFLYFKLIDFPIFNVADIYVTCSAVAFVLLFIFLYKENDFSFLDSKKKTSDNTNPEGESHS